MANKDPDQYEETRRRLGIINLLDFSEYSPGDPLLVRQVRKIDNKLKQSAYLRSVAKAVLPLLRRTKNLKNTKFNKKRAVHRQEYLNAHKQSSPELIKLKSNPKHLDVSIIIPAYNKINVTLNCLRSLSKLQTRIDFEVIVVDNGSTDSTSQILSKISNLVYVHNDENLGFVDGCNIGAKKAQGTFIVFLNNDTEVSPEWLDYLINPLSDKHVGLVGSKLIYPDESLQEAGGIIFKDGSGLNYGKHHAADYFEFNYRREVDYCSGASIAIRTSLFNELGGFDKRFAPAYYEDTDLAFQVRAKGLRVIYEPRSIAYHIEGVTAGTNINSGFKRYQAVNQKKFLEKWSNELATEHYSPEDWYLARDNSGSKLALIIDDRVPTPDMDSGSQRMVRLIRNIQELGYKVTLWPKNLKYDQKYTVLLQAEGVEVVYGSVSFLAFASQFGHYYDLVILSRPYTAASYLESCRAWFYKATILYDTVDLHFLRTQRQAQLDPRHSKGLLDHSKAYQELEIGISRRVDGTLVVSNTEKDIIHSIDPSINVAVVSNIHEISESAYKHGFDERYNLMFIGGFDHMPNQDGIRWFCEAILPLIRQSLPEIKVQIVGANMLPKLKKMLSDTPGVEVLGYVEDVTTLFSESRLFICPLRYGAGVKGKVGQAIEYGIPVVSTSIGVEGMFMKNGESCLIADEDKDFANAVLSAYSNKELWTTLRDNAQKILSNHFSNQVARNALSEIITKAQK